MTKDKVLERIKTLEAERDQVRANLLAYEGAIQDCTFWLTQFDSKEEEVVQDNAQ